MDICLVCAGLFLPPLSRHVDCALLHEKSSAFFANQNAVNMPGGGGQKEPSVNQADVSPKTGKPGKATLANVEGMFSKHWENVE
jgi:hypothetical protein